MTNLTVKQGIKKYGKEKGVCIGKDTYQKLEDLTRATLDKALERVIANKRKTINATDL